jgi:hypothetical protein
MRAVVEYNRKHDSFRVIDKDYGEIPIDFETEAEAWDFVLDCESDAREWHKAIKYSCKGGYTVRR